MRTSSRSLGSKSTRSSSLVAARSRWLMAREKPGRVRVEVEADGDLWRGLGEVMSWSELSSCSEPRQPGCPRVRSSSMSETWATFGVDLHLDLAGPRLRAGLERGLREAVETAACTRDAAAVLAYARPRPRDRPQHGGSAYGQLVAEGWLTARPGSGTRVADRAGPNLSSGAPQPAQLASQPRHDLRPGTPDLSTFPRAAWLAAARRALNSAPYEAFGYPDPRGRRELRTALPSTSLEPAASGSTRTASSSSPASAKASGCSPRCCRRAVRERLPWRRTAMQGHRRARRRPGLRLRSVPVDDHGASVDDLGGADAVAADAGAPVPARRGARAAATHRRRSRGRATPAG